MGDPQDDELGRERATQTTEDQEDVEGSSMFLHPGLVQDLGRVREADLQRDIRARAQASEAEQARKSEALQASQPEVDAPKPEAQRQSGPFPVVRAPGT